MVKVMAKIISPLMMILLNQDAMIIQNVIFIVKVRFKKNGSSVLRKKNNQIHSDPPFPEMGGLTS